MRTITTKLAALALIVTLSIPATTIAATNADLYQQLLSIKNGLQSLVLRQAPAAPVTQASADTISYITDFSTLVDGNGDDQVRDVAIDSQGYLYVTGGAASFSGIRITAGNDFYRSGGTISHGSFAPFDVFVQKYAPNGTLVWSTRIGGVNYDRSYAIEVDSDGVYVAGRAGEDFYVTSGVAQPNFGGDQSGGSNKAYGTQDGFVSKLSPTTGELIWSTYAGGASGEFIRDMDVDANGVTHFGLTFVKTETGQPITSDAFQSSIRGPVDDIYGQLSSDGSTFLYGTFIGGDNDTQVHGGNPSVFADPKGDVTLVTSMDGTNAYTSSGAYQPQKNGAGDLYIVKFDGAQGNKVPKAATYFGGSSGEGVETHAIAGDPAGNIFVASFTQSNDLPTTNNAFQPNFGGGYDGMIFKFSPDLSRVLAGTYLGTSGGEGVEGVAYQNGSVYVGGGMRAGFPVTDGSTHSGASNQDAFVARLSDDLTTLQYATYFGGSAHESARSLDAMSDGTVAVGGATQSSNFPTKNAIDSSRSGPAAGFVTYFTPSGP